MDFCVTKIYSCLLQQGLRLQNVGLRALFCGCELIERCLWRSLSFNKCLIAL